MTIKISQDMLTSHTNNMLNSGTSSGKVSKPITVQNTGNNVLMDLDSIFSNPVQSNTIDMNSNQNNNNQQKSDLDSIFSNINFGSSSSNNNANNANSMNLVGDSNSINNSSGNTNTVIQKKPDTIDIFSQISNVLYLITQYKDLWKFKRHRKV